MSMNPQPPQYEGTPNPQQPPYAYGNTPGGAPNPGQPPYSAQQPQYPPPPPPYSAQQQPQYTAPAAAPSASVAKWGPSSIGMEPNLAAGLSYLIPIVGLIFFFMEKTNRFVRFHAAQSIVLSIGVAALWILDAVLGVVASVFWAASYSAGTVAGLLSAGIGCLGFLVFLGAIALYIWGMVAGFTDKYVKLPIIGSIAEKWAGGQPA